MAIKYKNKRLVHRGIVSNCIVDFKAINGTVGSWNYLYMEIRRHPNVGNHFKAGPESAKLKAYPTYGAKTRIALTS